MHRSLPAAPMRATADPSVEFLIEGDALCEPLERAGSQERAASGGCTDRTRATGRTHQIRVHMKHIGHALLGDKVYLPDRSQGRRFGVTRHRAAGL